MERNKPNATSEPIASITALDEARLARWPVPYESLTIQTRFGDTHIITSGNQGAPPLVLIHALGVTSTMWLPNIAALSRDYRTYALDTIGDIGQSVLTSQDYYPKNGQAYSNWLVDVFDELGINQAHLIGSSMGGWITMNHSIYAPERVNHIALLGPMGLPSWLTTLKVLSHLWHVLLFPTKTNIDKTVRWALGEEPSVREELADYLVIGATSFSSFRLAPPLPLSDAKLKMIRLPVLLLLGERDHVIGNASEVANRARRTMPQVQVEIISGAGHMMNTEKPEFVNRRILSFLQEE